MEYRRVRESDWQQIIPLVNEAFKESAPMEKAFPFLFNKSNNTSYVAAEDGEIVAFIGGIPSIYSDNGQKFSAVSIGSVCTKEGYRGKGIADKLLKRAILDYQNANLSFALISGDRELYLRNGFVPFGSFKSYDIRDFHKLKIQDEYKYVITRHKDDIESLLKIHELYDSKNKKFFLSLNEFKLLMDAKALIRIGKMEQEIILAQENGKPTAFAIIGIRKENDENVGRVIECGGTTEGIIYILKAMGVWRNIDVMKFVVNDKEEYWQAYLKEQDFEVISNQGTYLPFKDNVDKDAIPYTCNLSYV